MRRAARLCGAATMLVNSEAFAHAGERAFVLLLPTAHYMFGAAVVVALSFVLAVSVPARWAGAYRRAHLRLPLSVPPPATWPGAVVLALVAVLVAAGFLGSRDPLHNPLPTALWSLWWVGLTLAHALCGNLWAVLNPWRALHALAVALPGLRHWRTRPPLRYPAGAGYWPALASFAAFAWFELVYPAPQDPARVALAVLLYTAITLLGMLAFGRRAWLRRAEAFSVFFRIVAWLAPVRRIATTHGAGLALHWPGARLLRRGSLAPSGVGFVLLVLASVSFDGLSRTFAYLDLLGQNPLEYPGRTALMAANSLGFAATFAAFVLAYLAITAAAGTLAGIGVRRPRSSFVLSIVPIAFGYHFAHYLPAFLVDAQHAVRALSDPFARGWDLFGTARWHVTSSFLSHHASVEVIWNLQTAAIVLAHVFAVLVAHCLMLRDAPAPRAALRGEAPVIVLMIAYTLFGLWLLSTPTAG